MCTHNRSQDPDAITAGGKHCISYFQMEPAGLLSPSPRQTLSLVPVFSSSIPTKRFQSQRNTASTAPGLPQRSSVSPRTIRLCAGRRKQPRETWILGQQRGNPGTTTRAGGEAGKRNPRTNNFKQEKVVLRAGVERGGGRGEEERRKNTKLQLSARGCDSSAGRAALPHELLNSTGRERRPRAGRAALRSSRAAPRSPRRAQCSPRPGAERPGGRAGIPAYFAERRSATGGRGARGEAGRILTYAVFLLPFGGNPTGHGAEAAGAGGDARTPLLRRHFPTAGREKFLPTAVMWYGRSQRPAGGSRPGAAPGQRDEPRLREPGDAESAAPSQDGAKRPHHGKAGGSRADRVPASLCRKLCPAQNRLRRKAARSALFRGQKVGAARAASELFISPVKRWLLWFLLYFRAAEPRRI